MPEIDGSQYPQAFPHGDLQEIRPDVFFLPGSIKLAPLMSISRNMVVLRQAGELTVINAVRMRPDAEARLDTLGTVKHVMRLGCFHGLDDAYYVARYGAQFWCQPDSHHYREPAPDHLLGEDQPLPVAAAELFVFRDAKRPECALLLKSDGGLLITCDGLQYYGDFSRHSLAARTFMRFSGFYKGLLIGPLWLKYQTQPGGSLRPDFERLAALPFDAVVSAHGTPLLSGARAALTQAVARARWPDHAQ